MREVVHSCPMCIQPKGCRNDFNNLEHGKGAAHQMPSPAVLTQSLIMGGRRTKRFGVHSCAAWKQSPEGTKAFGKVKPNMYL